MSVAAWSIPVAKPFEASDDVKAVQPAHLRNRDFDVECIERQAAALKRLRPKEKLAYVADPSGNYFPSSHSCSSASARSRAL
ncbi:hypothetical protein CO660_26005 [Rhizobium sp. L9]|nr:hypothetical protein CO660_26005 [Rhizobium sp. L9]